MKKRKKGYGLWLLCLCMVFLCTACSKETGKTEESSLRETEETKAQGQKEAVLPEEAPEGYVYDYQVSMDPIPKEIADLGGPCVGTMHAFPTRIEMALTQQEVEKDPELKAEVEKCTQEVKDALAQEVGGEFEVQVMSMDEDKFTWQFFCKEVSTGYEFAIGYTNFKYNDPNTTLEGEVYISDYYSTKIKKTKSDYEKEIYDILQELFPDGNIHIVHMENVKQTSIGLTQFSKKEISKKKEQEKILELWEKLEKWNDQGTYLLQIEYYPEEYREMLEQRYKNGIYEDIFIGYKKDKLKVLIEDKEIYDYFFYFESLDEEKGTGIDTFLKNYRKGTYDENKIWDYWIGGH